MSAFRTLTTDSLTSWIAPDKSEPDKVVAYVNNVVQNYNRSLQSSGNYHRLHKAIKALMKYSPDAEDDKSGRLSNLSFNRTKRQATKLVAILSDIRPTGDFETSDPELADQANVLSQLYKALWSHPSTQVRKTLISLFQYALTGEGYLYTSWESDPFRNREPTLSFQALSIDDIAFAQLPKDKDIQKAYCTVIRHEMPIAMACMLYPKDMAYFSSTSTIPKWLRPIKKAVGRLFESEALNASYEESMSGNGFPHSQAPVTSESTIDIYECYIMDFSVNKSGKEIEMGEPSTPEYYKVPYIGQEIPTCLSNLDGKPITRKATEKDCLIYPNRRRVICTNSHLISDTTSPWAHGQTPLTRFTLNDWVWDRIGDPVALEGERLNFTIEAIYKGFHDMMERQFRPGMKLPNTLSESTRDGFDARKAGVNLAVDPFTNTSVDTVIPYQLNVIQNTALEFTNMLKEECDYMIGEPDLRALTQAQQVPSAKTFEKFLELAGPLTMFVALNIEASLMEVGEQVKALLMQYCTAPKRYHILGRKGLTNEDFDYDPGNMVPSKEKMVAYGSNIFPTTLNERTRLYSRKFTYRIMPGAAYQLTDVQRQMMILQLWMDPKNFPISPWTVAEAFGIKIGPIPEGLTDELKAWEWWQRKQAELGIQLQGQGQIEAAKIQLQIQQAMQQQQAMQALSGLSMLAPQDDQSIDPNAINGLSGTDLEKRGTGRPPSGQEAPSLQSKDGGTRQTITES